MMKSKLMGFGLYCGPGDTFSWLLLKILGFWGTFWSWEATLLG